MFFSIRRKKVTLDCFTSRADLHSLLPVSKSSKAMPDWWKNLPSQYATHKGIPSNTMKSCVGFIDYFKNSFYIPFWSDAVFQVGSNIDEGINYTFADGSTNIDVHNPIERGSYLPKETYQHLKIQSPWMFECNKDIKFLLGANTWVQEEPEKIIVPPGIVDFKYQKSTNYNIFIKYTGQKYDANIKAGTAIVTYTALTEDDIIIHNHLLTDTEFRQRRDTNSSVFSFSSHYRTNKKLIDAKTSKCPFH